jgi:hypothetical protein
MIIVRYTDDIVVGFEREADAKRFRDDMGRRLAEFAPTLNPEKTRLIEFGRFAADHRARRGLGKPAAFLPKPRVRHPWPSARFAATHPRWEPYALRGTYGSVRGREVTQVPTAIDANAETAGAMVGYGLRPDPPYSGNILKYGSASASTRANEGRCVRRAR